MIDLRSDTVTKPSPAMRKAMADAEVGDDVFGEDPTVRRLEETVAEVLGKEAALFVPTGVMANQISLKIQTQPGDEVIVEAGAHILQYETAAAPIISGVQLRQVAGERGVPTVAQVEDLIRGSAYYMPPTRLICLENTHNKAGGTIVPLETLRAFRSMTTSKGLSLHVDGARLWNASVASGVKPRDFAACADTVSVCFSKGLGAPVGSAVAGSRQLITKARKVRKILGGGMRQAGIIAAGALFALQNNVDRLAEDHEKARTYAEIVGGVKGFSVDMKSVQTNIVAVDVSKSGLDASAVIARMKARGVLLSDMDRHTVRAVMHLDVSQAEVRMAANAIAMEFGA
ncbi:MAG: threonine aldolase [Ignavibacteria bacterium RIFCSPLOWO2_02_FULL_55_14]|nr:MAG: threonine aldolase [Ignavibacteria bacterium GWC2_56_12]OGU67479.1 MAG: threonine aldolase [Ignavibacteria bacterium RIFCSPHIGHO2_02_FULL_56_12]OGU72685.1 MAG: threonine aldolase [Ignavibacteria bacterium RIFCSPLOWO2_02_FULL_55_14]OGU73449.1 MAG: threonine aldolase [Ignavibacteria bacterium RIFCSPLOWO2_12_FULL_56_21]